MYSKYMKCFEFVEEMLKKSGRDVGLNSPFRIRSKHSHRVYTWAIRLSDGDDNINKSVLLTAAIFHDVGYAIADKSTHHLASANIFHNYAMKNNFDVELTDEVEECIKLHSNKELLKVPSKLTKEQILLMEADLLDEEGALFVCRCDLKAGYNKIDSYSNALEQMILLYNERKNRNPMVTERAKMFWSHKQNLVESFIKELEYDLYEY